MGILKQRWWCIACNWNMSISRWCDKEAYSCLTLPSRWERTTFGSVRQELRQLRRKLGELRGKPLRLGPSEEEKSVETRLIDLWSEMHQQSLKLLAISKTVLKLWICLTSVP
jgi:hypothetical protein